jgi:hypothetical protein
MDAFLSPFSQTWVVRDAVLERLRRRVPAYPERVIFQVGRLGSVLPVRERSGKVYGLLKSAVRRRLIVMKSNHPAARSKRICETEVEDWLENPILGRMRQIKTEIVDIALFSSILPAPIKRFGKLK